MKKFFSAVALCALSLSAAFAQTYQKGETTYEFKPYGYMQLQAGVGQTIGEGKATDLLSPAAALNFGYQFKPAFGLRAGLGGLQGKGAWANSIQTKGDNVYKFNYVALNVDAVLNISNLIAGWNPFRTVNVSAFIGVAGNLAFNNDEAHDVAALVKNYPSPVSSDQNFNHLWDDSRISPVGRMGLIVDFRCNDRWNINLEGNGNITTDHFNSKHADNADWYLNYLVGATYKFSDGYTAKTIRKTEPEPEPVAMCGVCNKPVTECQYHGNHPKCVTCGKYIDDCEYHGNHPAAKPAPATFNIFFERNKSVVLAEEDLKIKAAAEYLKANPEATASIVSYADVKTGNAKLNQKLSEARSAIVAKYLIENYGIAADRVSTESLGDTKQPFAENDKNRVSIITTEVK